MEVEKKCFQKHWQIILPFWIQRFCLGHPPFSFSKICSLYCSKMLMLTIYILIFVNLLNIIMFSFLWVIQGHLLHVPWFTPIFGEHLKFLIFQVQSGLSHLLTSVKGFYLKQKSEMSEVFPSFFKMIKNQFEVYIKNLRSDNVRDLFNQTFSHFLQKEGIVHYSSYVHTPQQNEATEQKNRHLLEDTRALLFQTHVSKSLGRSRVD